jgi:hypothetical protein
VLLAVEQQHNRVIIQGRASPRGIGRVVTFCWRCAHPGSFRRTEESRASEQTTTPQTATVAVGIEGGCFGALAGRVFQTRPAA